MQIVWCLGGLGNQMFQYAFYRSLQLSGNEACLDISSFVSYDFHNGYELERVFGLCPVMASENQLSKFKNNILLKILNKANIYSRIIKQKNLGFDGRYLQLKGNKYFEGYWQSEKYFKNIEAQIRTDFTFPKLDEKNQIIANDIIKTNSISIHIRMGDYVNHPLHGGICTLDYYKNAIKIINENIDNPKFYIFSNDIAWCKENLKLENVVYVLGNDGDSSYKDMQLMSLCKHNIIANSSFSWWGAWLNNNPSKVVVAPNKWLNDNSIDTTDLLPSEWIRI